MIRWHQIDKATGAIRQTVTAPSRAEAFKLLGGGMVVSAASWKLDVFKYEPIKTVVTDITQDQEHRAPLYTYKKGFMTVREMARRLNARENQLRHIIDRYHIPFVAQVFGGRKIRFFSTASCRRIGKILDKTDPERIMQKAVERSYALARTPSEET